MGKGFRKNISRDCTNVKWRFSEYTDKDCKNRKGGGVSSMSKCHHGGSKGPSIAYKCNKKEIEFEIYKGGNCKGQKIRAPKAWKGPKGKYEFDYDSCVPFFGGGYAKIHPIV